MAPTRLKPQSVRGKKGSQVLRREGGEIIGFI
jgi:hypothetical protein